ncbi:MULTISPECIES: glycoside hydrolase family 19 protein [unclassified Rhizobium]|uniref:glycoside hydrolase family 19 protein n=1 Tax=unclassified Rhizobium TaxID=2613769 RepID=UPI000BC42AB6|nr:MULTISPECIES: glycoside hydrolase family 19 protein [unclassified Rhizobium]MDH7809989.1 hypothetical protein [Rhizobium sp. AN67]MDQ4409051.1 glycoside hydrolase family 19 protein [Rhizobium sp. AN63]SOD51183.1 Chitinase class I [Rhizobium sp. AN6A]
MRNLLIKSTNRRSFMLLIGAGVNLSLGGGGDVKQRHANDNDNNNGPDPAPTGGALAIRNDEFYKALRATKLMGTRLKPGQIEGMEGIFTAFQTDGDGNPKTLAYAFATAAHETGFRMLPVREGFAKSDAQARRRLQNRPYSRSSGKYGHAYYGRGQAQLTWEDNYRTSSGDAGVDLVANPDMMLDPVISAKVLIRGLRDGRWNGSKKPHTGKGIGYYLPTTGPDDVKNARRTLNKLDKWNLIAGYYRVFLGAITQSLTH